MSLSDLNGIFHFLVGKEGRSLETNFMLCRNKILRGTQLNIEITVRIF